MVRTHCYPFRASGKVHSAALLQTSYETHLLPNGGQLLYSEAVKTNRRGHHSIMTIGLHRLTPCLSFTAANQRSRSRNGNWSQLSCCHSRRWTIAIDSSTRKGYPRVGLHH